MVRLIKKIMKNRVYNDVHKKIEIRKTSLQQKHVKDIYKMFDVEGFFFNQFSFSFFDDFINFHYCVKFYHCDKLL